MNDLTLPERSLRHQNLVHYLMHEVTTILSDGGDLHSCIFLVKMNKNNQPTGITLVQSSLMSNTGAPSQEAQALLRLSPGHDLACAVITLAPGPSEPGGGVAIHVCDRISVFSVQVLSHPAAPCQFADAPVH